MADRPRNDDWWLASDGKWYPPDLAPGDPSESLEPTVIRPTLTRVASLVVAGASILLAVAAFFGFRLAPLVRSGEVDMAATDVVPGSTEIAYAAWSVAAIFAFVLSGIIVVAWMHAASKAMEARGPTGRRWRGAWAIWGWVIPLGNFVIPKLMFGEVERIAQEPFDGMPVGDHWKARTRTSLADLWWALWVGALLASQIGTFFIPEEASEAEISANTISFGAGSFVLLAGAGVVLSLVIRRTEAFSRR